MRIAKFWSKLRKGEFGPLHFGLFRNIVWVFVRAFHQSFPAPHQSSYCTPIKQVKWLNTPSNSSLFLKVFSGTQFPKIILENTFQNILYIYFGKFILQFWKSFSKIYLLDSGKYVLGSFQKIIWKSFKKYKTVFFI